jgi:hypothetical protein
MQLNPISEETLQTCLNQHYSKRLTQDRVRQIFPFHAPCPQLCNNIVVAKGFHFTCLTCPTRIFTFKKRGYKNLSRRQTLIMVMESASGRGFIMPKNYDVYGLIVPRNINKIRRTLIKLLASIAERIAEA